jgi:uncharacterized protein (DUF4415 family)
MSLAEARAAQARGEGRSDLPRVQAGVPYVWDGRDEADRPLSREEMQAGLAAARRGRGRPAGSDKESTTIRLDRDILDSFRAQGPGWQTRINAALREWLERDAAHAGTTRHKPSRDKQPG